MAKTTILTTHWRCERCGWTGTGVAVRRAQDGAPTWAKYFNDAALRHYQEVEADGGCRSQSKRRTELRMTRDHYGEAR